LNGLDRIREAAARDGNLRFTSLMHHITEEMLWDAYNALKRDAASGVDDVTWHEYGEGLEVRTKDLHDRVKSAGSDKALEAVHGYLPDGRQRPIS
jgi:hypothetical protein